MDQGPWAKAWGQGRSLKSPQERHSCAEGVKSPFSGTAWERITVAVKQLAFGAKVSLWNVPGTRGKGWEALTPRSCLLGRWDAPGSRPSGNFPQGHPREPHGALRLAPKLADPSAGPSRPSCPTGPQRCLPRVPAPFSRSVERVESRQARPALLGPPLPTPPSLRDRDPPSLPLMGLGPDLPTLGPRLCGPPRAEGGSAGRPVPEPGTVGGGRGVLLRETRFTRAAAHLRLLRPPPTGPACISCPCPSPSHAVKSVSSICPGRGSEGHRENPGAYEGRSPPKPCLQNPSDGPAGPPSAPRPSV